MNIALLIAAGSARRMNHTVPKQFIHVDNKPVIIHTMEAFQNHPSIDAILVVTLDSWMQVLIDFGKEHHITKLKWVVPGGDTGQNSIYRGLCELRKYCTGNDTIIVHDGNRPLITNEIISDSLATYYKYGGAVAAIPCQEAVFKSDDAISSREYIPRESLFRTQTPHTYSLEKIWWAHEEANKRGLTNTVATCTLMHELGEQLYFSLGSEINIKLTTIEDLHMFKAILHMKENNVDYRR